jgi:hypothetical protein
LGARVGSAGCSATTPRGGGWRAAVSTAS